MCQAQKYKHTCKLHLPVNLSLENLLFIKSFFKKKRVHDDDDEEVEEGKVKNRKRDFSSIYISSIPPRIYK